jgi:hypothetical protein
VFSAIALAQFPTTCPEGKPNFSGTAEAVDAATGCRIQGLASSSFTPEKVKAEEAQNRAKNNFCAQGTPAGTPKAITVKDMIALQASVSKQKLVTPREPPVDRSGLVKLGEGDRVQLTGFVFEARQEGGESVNCGDTIPDKPAFHDIHIALLEVKRKTDPKDATPEGKANAGIEECGSIVAEMSPHFRPAAWNSENLTAIGEMGLPVRVTGNRFFDASHVPCSAGKPVPSQPKRISLWEIHPIYAFEVCPKDKGTCATGGWEAIEKFCAVPANCKAPAKSSKKKSGE